MCGRREQNQPIVPGAEPADTEFVRQFGLRQALKCVIIRRITIRSNTKSSQCRLIAGNLFPNRIDQIVERALVRRRCVGRFQQLVEVSRLPVHFP